MLFSRFKNLHIQRIMPVFFAWRLLEWLQSYDGIKFVQLKDHLVISDKNQLTLIPVYFEVWSDTRGVM